MNRITYRDFLAAFKEATDALDETALDAYSGSRSWTTQMLSGHLDSSVLRSVCNKLQATVSNLTYREQWYTVDALFVSEDESPGKRTNFPAFVHCIVEHENGPYWHEEIWKLAHWRCPLKVLIGYDFNEDLKNTVTKGAWCANAIQEQKSFLRSMLPLHGEESGTDYLLIVGHRRRGDERAVHWRACLLNKEESQLQPISELV